MNAEIKAGHNEKIIKPEKIKALLMPGEVGATIELTVRDNNGKITDHRGPMRSKSFVRQFLELLWVQARQAMEAYPYSMRDITNTLRNICESADNLDASGGAGDTNMGIMVGTGNTAPTINNYVMETLIAHGVGAGQLQYSAVTFGAPASDATTSQFTITRDFANGSGGAITVNEVGLYVSAMQPTTLYYFLTIRDVIGGGINIPNGQTLTINYRPQATV